MFRKFTSLAVPLCIVIMSQSTRAELFTWDIDSVQSYVRLAIPDQPVDLTPLGIAASGTARVRGSVSGGTQSTAWSDTNGRFAHVDGTFLAEYTTNGVGQELLTVVGSEGGAYALNSGNYRPNPASFDGTTFTDSSTSPAPFAAHLYISVSILTLEIGWMQFYDVALDMSSGTINLASTANAIPMNATNLGISSANLAVDGTGLAASLDTITSATGLLSTNVGAGSISASGLNRTLTLNINVPISIPLDDNLSITATVTGLLVATATVPETSTVVMVGIAGLAAVPFLRRRRNAC